MFTCSKAVAKLATSLMWYFERIVSCVGEPRDGVLKGVLEVYEIVRHRGSAVSSL
jgi:hypothetical protein